MAHLVGIDLMYVLQFIDNDNINNEKESRISLNKRLRANQITNINFYISLMY